MMKVGITGGIGSGKSLICNIFKTLGCKVYNADDQAKILLDASPAIRAKVIQYFGKEIFHSGKANRKLLGEKVFNNPDALKILNSIIHPAVFRDFDDWLEANLDEPYIIKEAAIMFETGANQLLDKVVLVHSPFEIRLKRVMERDQVEKDIVLAKMQNQMGDQEKMKLSDYIIYNDEEHSLVKQVLDLHHKFLSIS